MLTTAQALSKYGQPNEKGTYLKTINLPYPMRIAWDLDTKVTRMRCHKDVADAFLSVFNELLAVYGYERIVELGIDLYGGCFNFRKMRGGSALGVSTLGVLQLI
jgi:hypothetical protein